MHNIYLFLILAHLPSELNENIPVLYLKEGIFTVMGSGSLNVFSEKSEVDIKWTEPLMKTKVIGITAESAVSVGITQGSVSGPTQFFAI